MFLFVGSIVNEVRIHGKALEAAAIDDLDTRKKAFVKLFGDGLDCDVPLDVWRSRFDGACRVAESALNNLFELSFDKSINSPPEIRQGEKYLYLDFDGGDKNGQECEALEAGWLKPVRVRFKNGAEAVVDVGTLWWFRRRYGLLETIENEVL